MILVLLFAGNWSCRGKPVIEKSVNEESNLTKPKQITTEEKELLNLPKSLLLIQPIFLVDKKSNQILDIAFDHLAESEGYGAEINQEAFENQFIGKAIYGDSNSFGLNQAGRTIIEGYTIVDGLSGATITSKAAVEMINNGLLKYRNYNQQ